MAPRRPAVGDTVAHARFAQSGAAFGRHPTPDPTVAYGDEHPARLTGDEPFDAADVLEPALTLTGLPGGVVPGGLVVSQADDGDAAQRHVALPVAAFIEPVPVRPATGRGQRACAAELGERGLAPDAFGVIAGYDGQGRGDDDARAVHVGRRSRVLLEDRAHAFLQGAGLPFKRLPCLGGGFQCGRRAPLDQSAGGPALGEPVHAVPAPHPRYRSLTDSGAVTSRPLAESGIVVMADASWARWALRWRNASTHPSGLFGGPVPHRP